MKSISRVNLNLIIHRDLLHKCTDARIETLDGLYKKLSKKDVFKSKLGFKEKLIDTINDDFSHYPQIERLKENIEYWYQHSDAQHDKHHNAETPIIIDKNSDKFVFTEDNTRSFQTIIQDEKLDKKITYNEFAVMAERADFTDLLSKANDGHTEISNKVCRIYYKIWKVFDDKETKEKWKNAAQSKLQKINSKVDWKRITSQANKNQKRT